MGLPRLEKCCFCFELKTGCIFLGVFNAIGSFTMTSIMIRVASTIGDMEPTGDAEIDATSASAYVMAILLSILYLIRFLFDFYFIYGVVKENASIIKNYFIAWIIIFIMGSSIFFLSIDAYNAGTIFTEIIRLGPGIYTILVSYSYYKQLNSREEL